MISEKVIVIPFRLSDEHAEILALIEK